LFFRPCLTTRKNRQSLKENKSAGFYSDKSNTVGNKK